eukprot:TCONS_00056938-protein
MRIAVLRLVKWFTLAALVYVFFVTLQLTFFHHVTTSTSHTVSSNHNHHGLKESTTQLENEQSTLNKDETIKSGDSLFHDVQTLLLFIGYPRSGSTLLGSILDAHPNIVIANEYNVFAQWKNYTFKQKQNRDYLFNQLWRNSKLESKKLQRASTKNFFFSYHVPGTWQGRYEGSIKIIGDKKGTSTTRHIINSLTPSRYNHFKDVQNAIQIPVKFIHLVRNPFDNIATMTLRAGDPGLRKKAERNNLQFNNPILLRRQMRTYFKLVDQNVELREKFGENVLDVHYTSFIRQPKMWLKTICDFLEVFCSEDYLNKCVKIIFPKETYTRRYIVWPDSFKAKVEEKIKQVEFLNGLSFEIT